LFEIIKKKKIEKKKIATCLKNFFEKLKKEKKRKIGTKE